MMSAHLSMVMMMMMMMMSVPLSMVYDDDDDVCPSVHGSDGCDDNVCPSVPAGGGQYWAEWSEVTDSQIPAWSEAGR